MVATGSRALLTFTVQIEVDELGKDSYRLAFLGWALKKRQDFGFLYFGTRSRWRGSKYSELAVDKYLFEDRDGRWPLVED